MIYRNNIKNGDSISQLAFGCMRFPRKGNKIDQKKTTEIVTAAIERGVNYFDTAYIYPGSEEALGMALADTKSREKVMIATKLPIFLCHKKEDFDKLFNKQLARLQTDYIDYYFMHMLCDIKTWQYLISIGIEDWIQRKREEGKIRNLGFSYHGGRLAFRELLDARDWDFCMLQFNYLDENNQAGYSGMQYAHGKGVPVFVMEPLRGGFLVNGLSEHARYAFTKVNKERSLADWALRWVLNHTEVTMALSGMTTMEQLDGNIKVAENASPSHLSKEELGAYQKAVAAINKVIKVPCTGCGYCLPCPQGVDIPTCFSSYNESYSSGYLKTVIKYYQLTGVTSVTQSDASKCIKCGKCEKHCPQNIQIIKELGNVKRRTRIFVLKPAIDIMRKVLRISK